MKIDLMKSSVLKYALLVCIYASSNAYVCAQATRLDSLSLRLEQKVYNNIEEHLKLLSEYGNLCVEIDLTKAILVSAEQLSLAQSQKNTQYQADAYERMGRILYMQGKNDSAMLQLNRAIDLYGALGNFEEQRVIARNFLANVYRSLAKFDEAMEIYNESLRFFENRNDEVWTAKILANIGSLYYTAGNQAKGQSFTLKALELQRKTGDQQGEVVSLVNLTVFALNNNDFQQGILYGEEALQKLKTINITYYAAALIRVGYCYYMLNNTDKAFEYTYLAIDIYKKNNSVVGMMEGYRTLAEYYLEKKNYAEAKRIGMEALQQADTTNRLDIRLLYDLLKRASIYLNHHDDALLYSYKQLKLKEEDTNRDWAEKISEIEVKYQTEKKDIEIKHLHQTKKSQRILLISLISIMILGSIGVSLFINNTKNKRILVEQKVVQIENEKKLVATNALLEGETAERARLSKDLHDGLGGLLTVAKHKIVNMKGSLTIPEEQVEPFNSALEMLDKSISELRRVAHNLMPESLVRYGLNSAISDFCKGIDIAHYHFYGVEKRFQEKLEITVFRIVNELVNNALKHANATAINVQLVQDENRISVTVHDNGSGFDTNSVSPDKSSGLKNVKSRVVSYNGRLDILSTPNQGTEVSVEFYC